VTTGGGSGRRAGELLGLLSTAERLVAGGCLLLLVSMFLTWKDYQGLGAVNGFHGWGLVTLLVLLAAIVLLVMRSPLFRNTVTLPLLVTAGVVFIAAGGIEVLTLLLFSAEYGSGRSADFGYYLALLGAVLTASGGVLMLRAAKAAPAAVEPEPAAAPELRGGGMPTGGGPPEPPTSDV
jgi:hypothetical protein